MAEEKRGPGLGITLRTMRIVFPLFSSAIGFTAIPELPHKTKASLHRTMTAQGELSPASQP
jgi:hypothetical protein